MDTEDTKDSRDTNCVCCDNCQFNTCFGLNSHKEDDSKAVDWKTKA